MEGALICVTPIHCIHHVRHFLPCVSHGIFAFLSKFAAQPKAQRKKERYQKSSETRSKAYVVSSNKQQLKNSI